jgi:hypothetical protein
MTVSTVTDSDKFWSAIKVAYAQLPGTARWVFALSSTDGTRAVNVLVHDSVQRVQELFAIADPYGTTECLEADAANAVGLQT